MDSYFTKSFFIFRMEVATRLSKHFKNTFIKIVKLEEVEQQWKLLIEYLPLSFDAALKSGDTRVKKNIILEI